MGLARQIKRKQELDFVKHKIEVYIKAEPLGVESESFYTLAQNKEESTHCVYMTIEERDVVVKTEKLNLSIQNFLKHKCSNLMIEPIQNLTDAQRR